MNNQWLRLKQVSKQLRDWQALNEKYSQPKIGWVKMLRKALGMTAQQLAHRMGVERGRIVQLEEAEIQGAVTLRSLERVANAMDCELIYAIVPKKFSRHKSLSDIIKTRAEEIATEIMKEVVHSMSLETQTTSKHTQNEQKKELISKLMEGSLKKLWEVNDKT